MSEIINNQVTNVGQFKITGPQHVQLDQSKTVKFRHGLNRVPLVVQIQFSADESFDDVHIVQWPYTHESASGPVSIRADQQFTYLEFYRASGAPVFGAWSAATTSWQTFTQGYFRVVTY